MKIHSLHSWDVSPSKALNIQSHLRDRVVLNNSFRKINLIAGCDVALDPNDRMVYGGIIVYHWPDLHEVERVSSVRKLSFPYIPGLLAFREAPVLLDCVAKLQSDPDLFIFDGQGIAHPRRIGIATHMGLFLNKPAIGCAKSRLTGSFKEPGGRSGNFSPLQSAEGKIIGAVVRTRDKVRPIFVSPGHKIDLKTSVKIILQCVNGYRIPKPTREADRFVEATKKSHQSTRHQAASRTVA